ncbi:hypothetical protein V6N13_130641 [Hibiscus sabdariffa]
MDNVRRRLGMAGSFAAKKGGTCVGLLMMWSDRVTVDLLSFSDSHNDVVIKDGKQASGLREFMALALAQGRLKHGTYSTDLAANLTYPGC